MFITCNPREFLKNITFTSEKIQSLVRQILMEEGITLNEIKDELSHAKCMLINALD